MLAIAGLLYLVTLLLAGLTGALLTPAGKNGPDLRVAAAITFLMVVIFKLASVLDSPVRDVLEQVDLWWIHFQNGAMRGVLNLKDVVAYVASTYFFLLLAIKTMEAKRWQ